MQMNRVKSVAPPRQRGSLELKIVTSAKRGSSNDIKQRK
jgi:hypothetical protein